MAAVQHLPKRASAANLPLRAGDTSPVPSQSVPSQSVPCHAARGGTTAAGRDDRQASPLVAAVIMVVVLALGWPLGDLVGGAAGGATGAATGSATSAAAVGGAVSPTERSVHLVRPGETYWSIAAGLSGSSGDVRAVVDSLVEANGGRSLHPGDRVLLPWPVPALPSSAPGP